MLFLYLGTDRDKVRAHMQASAAVHNLTILRVTDAHTLDDLRVALQGGGMFVSERVAIFENLSSNPDMLALLLDALPFLQSSSDKHYLYEEKPLADVKKKLEKYADKVEKFDAPKKPSSTSVFAIADALKRGDKKGLWVSYIRELQKGAAPEAIHGILFWAAKDMLLKSSRADAKGKKLVADLADLPHAARRRGEDLEYALERFVLSVA